MDTILPLPSRSLLRTGPLGLDFPDLGNIHIAVARSCLHCEFFQPREVNAEAALSVVSEYDPVGVQQRLGLILGTCGVCLKRLQPIMDANQTACASQVDKCARPINRMIARRLVVSYADLVREPRFRWEKAITAAKIWR